MAATRIKRVPLSISRPTGVAGDSAISWATVRRVEHGPVEEDSDICALSPEIFGVSRCCTERILSRASTFVSRIGWHRDGRGARDGRIWIEIEVRMVWTPIGRNGASVAAHRLAVRVITSILSTCLRMNGHSKAR